MRAANRIFGLVIIIVGLIAIYESPMESIVRDGLPGPSLLPIVCSIVLVALGLITVLVPGHPEEKLSWPARYDRWRLLISFGGLVVYTALLPFLGFSISTTLYLAGMFWWWSDRHWAASLLFGVTTSVALILLFDTWLGVPLPSGEFARW